eukprot:353822_1
MNNQQTSCRYYGSMRGCRYGTNCRYNHSNPNSVPLCRYYNCQFGNNCMYRHINFRIQPQTYINNKNHSNSQFILNNINSMNNNISFTQPPLQMNYTSTIYPIINMPMQQLMTSTKQMTYPKSQRNTMTTMKRSRHSQLIQKVQQYQQQARILSCIQKNKEVEAHFSDDDKYKPVMTETLKCFIQWVDCIENNSKVIHINFNQMDKDLQF